MAVQTNTHVLVLADSPGLAMGLEAETSGVLRLHRLYSQSSADSKVA